MILRLYRAHASPTDAPRLAEHVRDRTYPLAVRTPGLRSFQAGVRGVDDRTIELALVTTWQAFETLRAELGPDLARPAWLGPVQAWLTPVSVDHFELVGEQVGGPMPLEGAVIRYVHGTLDPDHGETFFPFARARQREQVATTGIVASHLGRRIDGTAEEAIYVATWQDADAPSVLGGSARTPAAQAEWEAYFSSWTFASYDALVQVPRRDHAPALLLADDARRFVFATPEASRLLGRPLGGLLGLRVDDITAPAHRPLVADRWTAFVRDGSQQGPFTITPQGGDPVDVLYTARANTPWPGYHASVLDPSGEGPDLDAALSASGLILRREPVPVG